MTQDVDFVNVDTKIQYYCYILLVRLVSLCVYIINKNSSGDEIANVNFFTMILHTYFKIPKKRTYVV